MSAFIEVKNLSVDFDGKFVLKGVNLTVEEGEVIGILGKSGCGKTIFMHVLRGTEAIGHVTGEVLYHVARCPNCHHVDFPSKVGKKCECGCDGKYEPLTVDFVTAGLHDGDRKDVTKRISIMIQRTFALYGDDSVLTNILNALNEVGYKGTDAIKKAADLLEEVNVSHRMLHIARELSGGEKQRVVLARQLVKEPMLLLADEPTGTLDPMNADLVHKILAEAVETRGMTMIITSHWPDVILELAHKAVLLDGGEVIDIGEPKKIVDKFLEGYTEVVVDKPKEFGEPIIKVEHLTKKYVSVDRGVVRAIDDISFEVYEREIFGLIGESGAGKTTTSKILMGIVPPTSGEVLVRVGDEWIDMKVPGVANKGRATKYMGILYQEYSLYPHSTVIENLTESISLDLPYELGIRKAIQTLMVAGFTEQEAKDILNKQTFELSEGERHRVAMAQVLMKEPNIVIMDEPTGTMDPLTRASVTNSILNARDKLGETFVIVSHDMDFVYEVCDRVAYIKGGKIEAVGDPHEIVPKLVEKPKGKTDKKPAAKTTKATASKATASKATTAKAAAPKTAASKTADEKKTKSKTAAKSSKKADTAKKAEVSKMEEKASEKENIEINTDGGCV
ncbi:putative ABC transporter ATP-binding protein YejF [Methanimicrococcus sp. At1]|uniref:ABC transporter ATP-binding protein YejF n=1 Tax=Methanimicrococcus hacksteinii TaxID=3028293 RepID=A0ABU3VPP6_9EURY|nr:methyl coenzyme M reductase system, component A2 [Methanimicrococcus sp. At1]MDV0445280.1 putative ABC transporter ATP-binding protein YejF [Methanimicrococcus sp. At1]